MPDSSQESANKADTMKDRTLLGMYKQTGRRWCCSWSLDTRGEKNDKKRGEEGWRGKERILTKNSGLFHELSKGIKGLMNCPLDARSLSDRQWSKTESGCHKSAHVRAGHGSISWLGGVLTESLTLII